MTVEINLDRFHPPRPYATHSHMHTTPSPRSRSSRSHGLRYFGFLIVWSVLQFPLDWPLGLGLLYVNPLNPVYVRCSRFLDPPVSVFSLSLYRHPSIYPLFSFRFITYNKQSYLGVFLQRFSLWHLTYLFVCHGIIFLSDTWCVFILKVLPTYCTSYF